MANNDDIQKSLQDLLRIYSTSKVTLDIGQVTKDIEALKKQIEMADTKNQDLISQLVVAIRNARDAVRKMETTSTRGSVTGGGTSPSDMSPSQRRKFIEQSKYEADVQTYDAKKGMWKLNDDYQNASLGQKKKMTQIHNAQEHLNLIEKQLEAAAGNVSSKYSGEMKSTADLLAEKAEAQARLEKAQKGAYAKPKTAAASEGSGSLLLDAMKGNTISAADKAAAEVVAANNKRVADKLKSSLSGRPVETTASTASLDEAIRRAGSEGFNTYDSKSSMRTKENAEKRRIAAANKEQRKAESSEAHIATMSVKHMEWEEKLRLKRAADEEKDAQKRYVRQQTAAMDAIKLREKEADAVKVIAAKQADVEEKESLRRYMNQQTAAIKGIEVRNKEAAATAKAIQKQTDAEVMRDEKADRAWKKEQARRESAIIDRDQNNADAYVAEMERRSQAMTQAASAQATSAHRVGMAISMGLTYPLIQLGKASVTAAENMSKIEAGMTATMESAQVAGEEIKRLAIVSTLPGLNFKDMVQGSLTLQNTGMTAAGAERTIKSFGNALAKAGKGSEELKGVELALQQIMSKGKLVGQELRQLQERLPMIRQTSEKAFGTADTQALVKKGIGAQEYILGIVGVLEQEAQVPDNFANAMKNLSQEMFLFQDSVGKALAPAITSTANSLTKLTRSFREMPVAAQTMGVQVAALAAGSGPLLLLTSQILQIQVATAAWRKEMLLATGQAATMGQVIRGSVAGRMGVAALGIGIGILGGTLIAGDQRPNADGELTEAQRRRSIYGGAFGGLFSGAATGFMMGGPWGAVIGGGVGGVAGALMADSSSRPNKLEVPELRAEKSFAETGIDKNADEIREAFSKNADKERKAWYENRTLGVTAAVRPNQYGHVSVIDQAKAEIEKAKYKYAQDMQELTNAKKGAIESAAAARKHYEDLVNEDARLTAEEYAQYPASFNPMSAKQGDPVLKQWQKNQAEMTKRADVIDQAKVYADTQDQELATFDDTVRKQLVANQKFAAITAAQDKMRVEEIRISRVEKTAMKDASLAAAVYGKNDIVKQKITALDTYNRTIEDLTELYESGEDVTQRLKLAMAVYQTAIYAVNEAESELTRQENRAKTHAADIMSFIGEENELVTQELDARRAYWDTMEDLTKDFNKGINVEGRFALASASYQKQHSDIMKADVIDKRTRAVAAQVNSFEMYALQQEMGMIGSDMLKDTDPASGSDDYNKYWASRARIESSYAQRNLGIQNTPASKRIPNAQALSDAQYNAERIALDKSWMKSDKDRTDKTAANILSRIKANRAEADSFAADQERMVQAARDKERESMKFLGSPSELWREGAILGAQQRLNGPLPSSTKWDRGQQPEFWEIVKALQDITKEAQRLADATEFAKLNGAPTRPVPYYEQRVAS